MRFVTLSSPPPPPPLLLLLLAYTFDINIEISEIAAAPETLEFLVKATFVELYMERIRDLLDLSRTNLPIREDKTKGIWIDGCSELYCSSVEEVMDVVRTVRRRSEL